MSSLVKVPSTDDKSYSPIEITYKEVCLVMFPTIANELMMYFILLVESHFIGSLGNIEMLDGFNLGIWVLMVIFFFIVMGLIEGLPICSSKSYGAKNYKLFQDQVNHVFILCNSLFIIFISIYFIFSKEILVLLAGGDKTYIYYAHRYLGISIFPMFLELNIQIVSRYLFVQQQMSFVTFNAIVGSLMQATLCGLLVNVAEMDVYGAGLSYLCTNIMRSILLIIYLIFYNNVEVPLALPSKETFNWPKMKDTFYDCFFAMLVILFEGAGVWILILVANRLSMVDYGKFIVLNAIYDINAAIIFGVILTINIIVGNFIGENRPNSAKIALNKIFVIGLIIELLYALFIGILRVPLCQFFTETALVYSGAAPLVFYYCGFTLINFMQGILSGILRICNRLIFLNAVNFVILFILSPGLAYITSVFCKFGVVGIIITQIFIFLVLSLIFYTDYSRISFEEVCLEYHLDEEKKILLIESEDKEDVEQLIK